MLYITHCNTCQNEYVHYEIIKYTVIYSMIYAVMHVKTNMYFMKRTVLHVLFLRDTLNCVEKSRRCVCVFALRCVLCVLRCVLNCGLHRGLQCVFQCVLQCGLHCVLQCVLRCGLQCAL